MYWLVGVNLSSGNIKSNFPAVFKSSRGTSVWTLRHEVSVFEEAAWGSHHIAYVCRLWIFLRVDGFWATRNMDKSCAQRLDELIWDWWIHWLSRHWSLEELFLGLFLVFLRSVTVCDLEVEVYGSWYFWSGLLRERLFNGGLAQAENTVECQACCYIGSISHIRSSVCIESQWSFCWRCC